MPEVGHHYIGAEILVPEGDEMVRGHIVTCSHDANGNMMSRAGKGYQVDHQHHC